MMARLIHLHGMFFELVNGEIVRPPTAQERGDRPAGRERCKFDVTANEPGDWAFHCHLLYHMRGGDDAGRDGDGAGKRASEGATAFAYHDAGGLSAGRPEP